MKKGRCLGLLGGLGVGATIHYYRSLARGHDEQSRTLDIVITHSETSRVFEYVQAGDRDGLAEYLLGSIRRLKAAGAEIVIVSASADNWIRQWCGRHELQLIATRLETRNERLTGRIEGRNCHGQEKVRRITAAYTLSQYDEVYCYGDTKGDKPMLSLATFSFYRPFR